MPELPEVERGRRIAATVAEGLRITKVYCARDEIVRLADEAEVARARQEPPRDTRAYSRGRAIQEAHTRRLSGAATWHRVRTGAFGWRFFLDPLEPGR